jgi:glycosyltransferase involved in cell wall biosynthesis
MRFVVPGDIADTTLPSGGNSYDRRMSRALAATELAIEGAWPAPGPAARAKLARTLADIPDQTLVLLDGLVACGVPEIVVPHADRLCLVILVHLPLAAETGLAPRVAADLDARERKTLHAARAVVVTSSWAARRLVEHHELDAAKVHAVPPGTDAAPPATGAGGAPRLLCVASVTPRKGHDLLVEALAEVADLDWHCDCVGPMHRDPGHVERVRELIERHDLADRITLAGPRTGDDLAASYAEADLVVLPSRAETYGMVVTEALARRIPVLATDVDAVPDTLGTAPDGAVPGILVPPEDVPALAEALRNFLTDPELRDRLRTAARERVLEDWTTAVARMTAVLERLRMESSCAA